MRVSSWQEGYPTSPYLALFFNDQDIYWRLHRNLVGTPAGIDFVDHLWDYLKSHNSANKCVRLITVSLDTTDCPAKPYLMGCMHKGGVQVGTRLTPSRLRQEPCAAAAAAVAPVPPECSSAIL